MATEKIASKEAVEKALNSIGYSTVVNTDNPYYEIVSNKYFKIYIEEGNAGGDSPRRRFLEKLSKSPTSYVFATALYKDFTLDIGS